MMSLYLQKGIRLGLLISLCTPFPLDAGRNEKRSKLDGSVIVGARIQQEVEEAESQAPKKHKKPQAKRTAMEAEETTSEVVPHGMRHIAIARKSESQQKAIRHWRIAHKNLHRLKPEVGTPQVIPLGINTSNIKLSQKEIIQILAKLSHLKGNFFQRVPWLFFFKREQFVGTVEALSEDVHGSSTGFLYQVKDQSGKGQFIIKGIDSEDEVENLERMSENPLIQYIPLTPDFPIITRPEALFSYTVTSLDDEANEEETPATLSVLHLAKGRSLKEIVKDEAERDNLKDIFFQLGVSFAALNLYCAKASPDISIQALNDRLSLVHEDLHFGNIFVHKKPNEVDPSDVSAYKKLEMKFEEEAAGGGAEDMRAPSALETVFLSHPYRVYLIDNESMGRSDEESWFKNDNTGRVHRVSAQMTLLYFFPMIYQRLHHSLTAPQIVNMYYEGFIKGYASKFTAERQPEVIAFLARHMKKLNQFYLSVATNGVIDHPWSADETPLDDRLFGNYLERISDIASSDQSDSLANKLKKVDKILDRKFISDTGLPAK